SLNQGQYIEEAIRSVVEQDYPRIEHVVVDGGSTDGTLEVLRTAAEEDLSAARVRHARSRVTDRIRERLCRVTRDPRRRVCARVREIGTRIARAHARQDGALPARVARVDVLDPD